MISDDARDVGPRSSRPDSLLLARSVPAPCAQPSQSVLDPFAALACLKARVHVYVGACDLMSLVLLFTGHCSIADQSGLLSWHASAPPQHAGCRFTACGCIRMYCTAKRSC
jgi:hypothetical protein